ncbi:MAG: hypothetical protein V3U27_21495 [Candidatus Tectomicrobia bacterium]
MPEITATVVAKSAYGIKITDDGDWMNWSKVEYRGEPFNTEVQKGDRVQITYAETDGGKVFITTIDKVTGAAPVVTGFVPAGDNQPFPLDEDFPPDATSEPIAPVLDKDHSIVRQTCIKAAGMALQHNMGNAEEKAGQMTYLAGVLEDWCWR